MSWAQKASKHSKVQVQIERTSKVGDLKMGQNWSSRLSHLFVPFNIPGQFLERLLIKPGCAHTV